MLPNIALNRMITIYWKIYPSFAYSEIEVMCALAFMLSAYLSVIVFRIIRFEHEYLMPNSKGYEFLFLPILLGTFLRDGLIEVLRGMLAVHQHPRQLEDEGVGVGKSSQDDDIEGTIGVLTPEQVCSNCSFNGSPTSASYDP